MTLSARLTFTHGYAVTSHAAQGKTVDEVVLVASSRSFSAVSRESFYVGISRARERAQVFTDDAALLGQRVQEAHTRKAAVELEGLRKTLLAHGFVAPPKEEQRTKIAEKEAEPVTETPDQRPSFRVLRTLRTLRHELGERVREVAAHLRQWTGQKLTAPAENRRISRPQTARQRLMVTPPRHSPDGPTQSHGHRM